MRAGFGKGEAEDARPVHHGRPSFFRLWLNDPTVIGAPAPSGRPLARLMAATALAPLDLAHCRVVELGGGTGVFTGALIEAGLPPDRLAVFEQSADLARALRQRFPETPVIEADARRALQHVRLLGEGWEGGADVVVSGLPMLSMLRRSQLRILAGAFSLMSPEGRFVQFTYGPTVPINPAVMRHLGLEARQAGFILWNLPPARVHVVTRRR